MVSNQDPTEIYLERLLAGDRAVRPIWSASPESARPGGNSHA